MPLINHSSIFYFTYLLSIIIYFLSRPSRIRTYDSMTRTLCLNKSRSILSEQFCFNCTATSNGTGSPATRTPPSAARRKRRRRRSWTPRRTTSGPSRTTFGRWASCSHSRTALTTPSTRSSEKTRLIFWRTKSWLKYFLPTGGQYCKTCYSDPNTFKSNGPNGQFLFNKFLIIKKLLKGLLQHVSRYCISIFKYFQNNKKR